MKDKNLPNNINSKTLNELTDMANNIIESLEKEKNLENTIEDVSSKQTFQIELLY